MYKSLYLIALALLAPTPYMVGATPSEKYLRDKMPSSWEYTGEVTAGSSADSQWWKNFNDSTLDSLITLASTRNFNVLSAIHSIRAAEAAVGSARAGYFPTIGLSAGFTKGQNAGAIAGPKVRATRSSYFNLGVNASWEIDIFGRVASKVKSEKAALEVSRAEYEAVMLTLRANVATYYINLRTAQEALAVTRQHLESQASVLKITEARYEAGLVSKLDVAQAKTVYYSTQAAVPALEVSVRECINALAVLTGVYPDQLGESLASPAPQPDFRHLVPAGVPADLLRRRPDLLEAESRIDLYAAQLGIAKKEYLPSLSIQGMIGTAAHDLRDTFKKNSYEYSVAPSLSWTIFDGLARKYAVTEAAEQLKTGVDAYNLAVMEACQEVDNDIASYSADLLTVDAYANVLAQSTEAFKLSMELYKQGLTAFTNVVDAQINCLTYASSLVNARGNALIDLVNLYKALGGAPIE